MDYDLCIRRQTASPEPTNTVTVPLPLSDGDRGSGGARRSRKTKRSPRGLGRGLGRILTDSGKEGGPAAPKRPGLLQLVGADAAMVAPDRIRDFVIDAALGALADGFGLEGLVLAAQASPVADSSASTPWDELAPGGPDIGAKTVGDMFLGAKLPPSCTADSQLLYHIYGNLWQVLEDEEPTRQTQIDQHWLMACRLDGDDADSIAAVAVRKTSLQQDEQAALMSLLSVLVACCTENSQRMAARAAIAGGTVVTLKSDGSETLAEVTADWKADPTTSPGRSLDKRRIGAARDLDSAVAVAKAAAKAARPRCEVIFAGSSTVDESDASIVLIDHPDHGLRFGYAVRPPGDPAGPAEAVFAAALA